VHLIIDADPIVYRCGFAAERTDYHLVVESPAGSLSELYFTPKPKAHAGEQMRLWLKAHPKWEVLSKDRVVHPESEETALDDTRTQVQSIEKECREHYGVNDFANITIILSGPGNYRERLATLFPYKGNRDPEHKPYHYQAIRNHLTQEWGAIVVHGREADDECSILAAKYTGEFRDNPSRMRRSALRPVQYIIATIDKDLDQIPGEHYNYLQRVFYNQTERDSRLFFWIQCLSGDATDGIPGCWRVGSQKAEAFIRARADDNDRRIWDAIVGEYAASQARTGCTYVGCDPAAVALETARLVYLQKYEGELWNPPGTPHGLLPEYSDDE
jgi:hypothetical protein